MKISKMIPMIVLATALVACGSNTANKTNNQGTDTPVVSAKDIVNIQLSDGDIEVTVGGEIVDSSGVTVGNDIVYYEEGKDFTYGEGSEKDAHSKEEAEAHKVVHISEPGVYSLSGSLSKGQIAVDLGDGAKKDEDAVVTLILNGVDINCSVAPAVIFYNVYECGDTDTENATYNVDTSHAGANVIIADDTENNISGAYVARIYESYTLNEAGTEVIDSKKLHKYDAAFYSRRSMNVFGEEKGTGILNINATNEGLDSELHLTINGGTINIKSGNDGINTNEDGVSVTTINGGNVNIEVEGSTGEGDGIDSNGWLVINGGNVNAAAYGQSADAGIDSDMGIYINGGNVMATGNMLDRIENSESTYAVFSFVSKVTEGTNLTFKDADGNQVASWTPVNDCSILIVAGEDLKPGTYTLWEGDTQYGCVNGDMFVGPGGGAGQPFNGDGMKPFEEREMPEGMERPEDREMPGDRENANMQVATTTEFVVVEGANYFSFVKVQ